MDPPHRSVVPPPPLLVERTPVLQCTHREGRPFSNSPLSSEIKQWRTQDSSEANDRTLNFGTVLVPSKIQLI